MRTLGTLIRATCIAAALTGAVAHAQATLPLPANYKTIFENSEVLVMRVHYGAHEFVPMHDHTAYPTVYVYLNNSGEVDIRHEGANGELVTRPPTHTGAFRISPGMAERHSVTSRSDTPSDFLRVELKRIPADDLTKVFRGEAPPQPLTPGSHIDFHDPALTVERIICPATSPCPMPPSTSRALLIAIDETHAQANGADHLLHPGDVLWLPPSAADSPKLSAGAQCLRVSLSYP
jgi:hypothetical protein